MSKTFENLASRYSEFIPDSTYFECGIGWYDILDGLFSKIKDLGLPSGEYGPLKVDQIKEKFGTLRVYMNYYDERVESLIDAAEVESARTCEYCGKEGDLDSRGWWKTVCVDHRQKDGA